MPNVARFFLESQATKGGQDTYFAVTHVTAKYRRCAPSCPSLALREHRKLMASQRPKITVRPMPEQHEQLKERAAGFGYKSISQYLIDRGLQNGRQIESVDRERLERLLFELRKIGTNLNQMTFQLNRGYQNYSHKYLDRAFYDLSKVLQAIAGGEEQ